MYFVCVRTWNCNLLSIIIIFIRTRKIYKHKYTKYAMKEDQKNNIKRELWKLNTTHSLHIADNI